MTCARCGHTRTSHYVGRCDATTRAWDDWKTCDCPAFVEQTEHALCKDEWHRCHDDGGPGEYERYVSGRCGL